MLLQTIARHIFILSQLIENEKISRISVLRNDLRTCGYIRLSTSWMKLWMYVREQKKRDESFALGSWNFKRRSHRMKNRNFAAAEHSGRIKYRLRPENFPPRYGDYDEERGSERRGGGPRFADCRRRARKSRGTSLVHGHLDRQHYATADFNWIRAARILLLNLLSLGDHLLAIET